METTTLMQLFIEAKNAMMSQRSAAWENSPLAFLVPSVSIKSIGNIGEYVTKTYARLLGLDVSESEKNNDNYDVMIAGKRIEIKFATLSHKGTYIINQIRPQDYDYVLVFGVKPDGFDFYLIDKNTAWEHARAQHNSDDTQTRQLTITANTKRNRWYSSFKTESLEAALKGV